MTYLNDIPPSLNTVNNPKITELKHFFCFLQICKQYPAVCQFKFPQKKVLGNRDAKFVETRRKHLQHYLRKLVNYSLRVFPELSENPCKSTLLTWFPFFGLVYSVYLMFCSRCFSNLYIFFVDKLQVSRAYKIHQIQTSHLITQGYNHQYLSKQCNLYISTWTPHHVCSIYHEMVIFLIPPPKKWQFIYLYRQNYFIKSNFIINQMKNIYNYETYRKCLCKLVIGIVANTLECKLIKKK